jgi:hypothetical protein
MLPLSLERAVWEPPLAKWKEGPTTEITAPAQLEGSTILLSGNHSVWSDKQKLMRRILILAGHPPRSSKRLLVVHYLARVS